MAHPHDTFTKSTSSYYQIVFMKMRKKFFFIPLFLFAMTPANAQDYSSLSNKPYTMGTFTYVDAAVSIGTTGIGLELAAPVCDFIQLRAGFSFLPSVKQSYSFAIPGANEPSTMDEEGNLIPSAFDRMTSLLHDATGCEIDDMFSMTASPSFRNAHILADFYPIQDNKHWHFTAGFHWGTSTIATIENSSEDAPMLIALNAYNRVYDKAYNDDPLISYGDFDLYNITLNRKVLDHGRMGVEMGKHVNDGTPFILEPDDQGMVRASIQVNKFKPYLGIGYENAISPFSNLWHFSIECGTMLWGGSPRVLMSNRNRELVEKIDENNFSYTEWEYTMQPLDLMRDITDVPGRPGRMLSSISRFKVYPVLEFRFTRRLY